MISSAQPQVPSPSDCTSIQTNSNSILADHRRKLDKNITRVTGEVQFPLTGAEVRRSHAEKYLNSHEMAEVEEFEEVWYLSKQDQKYQATKTERLVNNGFDDAEGYYRIVSGDQIAYRFCVVELIGKGAFGQVLKCIDHKTGSEVAIKLVKNNKKYYYQAAVEAKLLLLLKENDPENCERVLKL
jgi:hypothetical protein